MKSFWQAWVMTWPTLKSFASHLSTTILRPLMPPAALHHLLKAVGGVEELLLEAGAAAAPGSAVTPMWIVGAGDAAAGGTRRGPGPQTAFSVPKSPGPAAELELLAEAPVDGPLLVLPLGELERPHADTSASAMRNADAAAPTARGRAERFTNELLIWTPGQWPEPSGE